MDALSTHYFQELEITGLSFSYCRDRVKHNKKTFEFTYLTKKNANKTFFIEVERYIANPDEGSSTYFIHMSTLSPQTKELTLVMIKLLDQLVSDIKQEISIQESLGYPFAIVGESSVVCFYKKAEKLFMRMELKKHSLNYRKTAKTSAIAESAFIEFYYTEPV